MCRCLPGPSQPELHASALISLFAKRIDALRCNSSLLGHFQGFSLTLDQGPHSTSLTQIFKDVSSLIL